MRYFFTTVALHYARRLTIDTKRTSPAVRSVFSITSAFATSCQNHHRYRTSGANDSSFSTTNPEPRHPNSPVSHSAYTQDEVVLPPPPTDCCMSGCAKCVWLLYAEELVGIYRDGGRAAEKVLEAVDDPSLKIFLSLELREKLKS